MQVALCMKFLRFPIHDQVTAQCIIQMQDVLSAAAQSEPKRGRRTCRGGGLEGASLLSCCQLDAQAAWSLGGPQGGGGIMESLGGEIPKRHHVNGQRASLKHQTRDNSTPVNGRLSDPFRANKLGRPGENPKFLASRRSSSSIRPRERVSKWWCANPGPLNLQCRTRDFSHHEFISHSKSPIHLPQPSLPSPTR